MTTRNAARLLADIKTNKPTVDLFRPSVTNWLAEYRAKKGEVAAAPKAADKK